MKRLLAGLLFQPITWLFIEVLEELKDEVYPTSYAKKLRGGKWLIKKEDFFDYMTKDMPLGF